jgi:hypothetical protein
MPTVFRKSSLETHTSVLESVFFYWVFSCLFRNMTFRINSCYIEARMNDTLEVCTCE